MSPISPASLVSRRLGPARWAPGAGRTARRSTCSGASRGAGHRHRGAIGAARARSSCRHLRHADLADRSVDGVSDQRCARRTRFHRMVHRRRAWRTAPGSRQLPCDIQRGSSRASSLTTTERAPAAPRRGEVLAGCRDRMCVASHPHITRHSAAGSGHPRQRVGGPQHGDPPAADRAGQQAAGYGQEDGQHNQGGAD
jgi:hypothetical protein